MKKVLIPLVAILIFFAACTKEKTDDPQSTPKTTAEKLVQNWTWKSNIDYNYVGASTTLDYIDTFTYDYPGDYVHFQNNGYAQIRIAGQDDSVTYNIISDSELMFDGDKFTINTLTDNELKFTYYERVTTPYFDNVVVLTR